MAKEVMEINGCLCFCYQEMDSADRDRYKDEFMSLYVDIFSAEPFWEKFEREQVEEMYRLYGRPDCLLYFVVDGEDLIGFGAGVPLVYAENGTREVLKDHLDEHQTFVNTEVAVKASYRGRGIGSFLIKKRIEDAEKKGFDYVLMRTTETGSMSARIYLGEEFEELPGVTEQVTRERTKPSLPDTDTRIFYWKKIGKEEAD